MEALLNKNNLNSVLYDEPFLKAALFDRIIRTTKVPILYLDFDLLYSGFILADFTFKQENLRLYRPTRDKLYDALKDILEEVSKEKSVVIIDSLNGFYNIFDEKDAGRLINSYIMLLALVASTTNSRIIFASMARMKDGRSWVLSPTGRQIITSDFLTSIHLKRGNSGAVLDLLDGKNSVLESMRISD